MIAKLPVPLVSDLVDGFPIGGLIIFAGVAGAGKSVFVNNTLINSLRQGYRVVYVTLDNTVDKIFEILRRNNIEPVEAINSGRLYVINGFSVEVRGFKPGIDVPSTNPLKPIESLSTIYMVLSEIKDERTLVILYSITEFLMRNEPGIALDFIKGLKLILRKYCAIGLATLHLGIEGLEQVYGSIEYISDDYIEMYFDPTLEQLGIPLRRLRVKKLKHSALI